MQRNSHSVEIERPAADVFHWISDPDRAQEWIGGLEEFTPLTDGGPRVGARSRQVISERGHRLELQGEITEFRPNEALQIRLHGRGFDVTTTFELSERNGRTTVRNEVVTRYKLFGRFLEPVVQRHAQRKLEDDLARLKRLAEGV